MTPTSRPGEGRDSPSVPARDGSPSRASSLARRGQSPPVPGPLTTTQGRGKPPRDLLGSGDLGFGAPGTGFPAVARPPIEPPFRAGHRRVRLAETVPWVPPPSPCDLRSPSYGRFPGRKRPIDKLAGPRKPPGALRGVPGRFWGVDPPRAPSIHTGWWKWAEKPGPDVSRREGGKQPRTSPGSGNLEKFSPVPGSIPLPLGVYWT